MLEGLAPGKWSDARTHLASLIALPEGATRVVIDAPWGGSRHDEGHTGGATGEIAIPPVALVHRYLPIICLAFSAVMAVVSTVTTAGTEAAQSRRIDFAMSIASLAPVG